MTTENTACAQVGDVAFIKAVVTLKVQVNEWTNEWMNGPYVSA